MLVSNWKSVVKPVNNHLSSNVLPKEHENHSQKRSSFESINKYRNSLYAENSDEDRAANGEYSPRSNAHLPVLDGKKYLNQDYSEECNESEGFGNSYNPSSTVHDYRSFRKHQGSSDSNSPTKHKHSSKHSSHSSVERNPKSERKKDSSPMKKESSSSQQQHHHAAKSSSSSGSFKHDGTSSKSSEKKHSDKNKKKIKKDLDEFTNSVASFEACLGFNDAVSTKSKAKTKPYSSQPASSSSSHISVPSKKYKISVKQPEDEQSYDPEHPEIQSTSYQSSKAEARKRKSEKMEPKIPEELKKPKLQPLEVDILSTLPDIQPNYKPLRHNPILLPDENFGQKKKSNLNASLLNFTNLCTVVLFI